MRICCLGGVQILGKLKQGFTAWWKTKEKLGSRNPSGVTPLLTFTLVWCLLKKILVGEIFQWLNWRKLRFPHPFLLLQQVEKTPRFLHPRFPLFQTLTRWRNLLDKDLGGETPLFTLGTTFMFTGEKLEAESVFSGQQSRVKLLFF